MPHAALFRRGRAALLLGVLGAAVALAARVASGAGDAGRSWWSPGQGGTLPAESSYPNASGRLGIFSASGAVEATGQPFFTPLGKNGRACVTCHQPSDAFSISVDTIRARWDATGGGDPLFAGVDGANCPNLPMADPASHSLLLGRGLIRVFLPWPPRARDGSVIEPEFTIEVVRDPTGCNSSPEYGLASSRPTVSVFRRPRPVANLRYVTAAEFGVGPFNAKDSQPAAHDPATGKLVNMQLMADAREPTLVTQAQSAVVTHLEGRPLGAAALQKLLGFETQVFAAQINDAHAGPLVEPGGPAAFGPHALATGRTAVLGNNTTNYVFPIGDAWRQLPRTGEAAHDARSAAREAIARGHDVFFFRTFWIKDAMHINTVGLGNPAKRTCATCHGMHMTGMDTANGWMDIGTTNLPWAVEAQQNPWTKDKPEMPLFKLTCDKALAPHPFLGRVIYTQDPGRALITGRCNDIGTIVMQQFRGLAARPPYFSNGSARDLRELVDFYDRRFNIQYSEQEKQDLVAFLSAL
jgi:cytochrome c peroxidase